jgi:hypothetical protein
MRDDSDELAALLSVNTERLRFSAERSAMQILACDGEIVAHYPVSDDVRARLLE